MDLAAAIRTRAVSPLEVVDAHIARIEAVNPAIHAVVEDRFELARAEAREATRRLGHDGGDLPPLHGVPFTVKEFIAVEGMPHTGGLLCRRDKRATADATVVQRLRAAGAIVLGVTNGPEGGLWNETYNELYGRTLNPWDAARTPGGSSGGEAAIVAAGGVPFGIGGDIGGSIRGPAAFCGTVGHKATGRMVPNTGQFPAVHGEHSAYNVLGPLARHVVDVLPILQIIKGPDGVDPVTRDFDLGDPRAVDLRDVVVHTVENGGPVRVSEVMRDGVRRAAEVLAARGARVTPYTSRRLRLGFQIWSAMMTEVGTSYLEVLGDGEPVSLLRELALFPLGRSRHTGPALLVTAADALARGLRLPTARFVAQGRKLQRELEELLGPRGVLLHPPYSRPAPRHHTPLLTPFDFACTAIFNVLELPVTQVPLGLERRGLPVGVQVVARRGADHLTLAVAAALEEDLGGWVRADPRAA
jgi:fatty acid amide hydrolase 2